MAKSASRSSGGNKRGSKGNFGRSRGGSSAQPMVDHDQIQRWAEQRGARPTCVRGTGGGADTGMIRLDFPGFSGEESLQEISWDDWFQAFDDNNLALLVQETTKGGEKSNFNKLVSRDQAAGASHRIGGSRSSGGRGASSSGRKSTRPSRASAHQPGKSAGASKRKSGGSAQRRGGKASASSRKASAGRRASSSNRRGQ